MVTRKLKQIFRLDRSTLPRVPDGLRVYAIGDIHGRLDLFDTLVRRIEADRADWPGHAEVVLLGDYIDRGPDSAALLDRLSGPMPHWASWSLLKGNHEQAMLDSVDGIGGTSTLRLWLENGGREALRSYGVPGTLVLSDDLHAIAAALPVVPPRHIDLLRRLKLTHRIGDYLFVHAGIRPGVPLDSQAERDLLWIRNEFLDCKDEHGCVVVHGHSITRDVVERPNRIGIDTGAYATGRLTALVLDGETRRYLSTLD